MIVFTVEEFLNGFLHEIVIAYIDEAQAEADANSRNLAEADTRSKRSNPHERYEYLVGELYVK